MRYPRAGTERSTREVSSWLLLFSLRPSSILWVARLLSINPKAKNKKNKQRAPAKNPARVPASILYRVEDEASPAAQDGAFRPYFPVNSSLFLPYLSLSALLYFEKKRKKKSAEVSYCADGLVFGS